MLEDKNVKLKESHATSLSKELSKQLREASLFVITIWTLKIKHLIWKNFVFSLTHHKKNSAAEVTCHKEI